MVNDDAELLERRRGGATDEFAVLVQRHQAPAYLGQYRLSHRIFDMFQ